MGIKGIHELVKKCLKEKDADPIIKHGKLEDLSGKTIAIDGPNIIFRLKAVATKKAVMQDMKFKYDEETGAWTGYNPTYCTLRFYELFINYINDILECGVKIIVVFDGAPPKEKAYILQERADARNKSKEKIKKLISEKSSLYAYKKALCEYNKPNNTEWNFSKNIIIAMGCKCYLANGEAEKLCSVLCKNGDVYAAVSNDTDLYAYECPFIVKNIKNFYTGTVYEYVCLNEILKLIDMDFEKFFNLCLMCGNDYAQRVKGFGPIRILKLLQTYGNYKSICKNEEKFSSKLEEYNIAKENFTCNITYTNVTEENIWNYCTMEEIIKHIRDNLPKNSMTRIRYKP